MGKMFRVSFWVLVIVLISMIYTILFTKYMIRNKSSILDDDGSSDINSPRESQKGFKYNLDLWEKPQIITRYRSTWKKMDDATCERKGDYLLGHIKSKTLIPIFLHPPDNDIHISRVLLNGGSWEKALLERMLRSMTQFPEAIFIDLGAHVGVYSLSIASHGHKVIAIDCYQGNVERLCASTKAAKLSNRISIIYNAISKTRGNVHVRQASSSNVGSNAIVTTNNSIKLKENLEIIQAITLSDVLEIFNINSAVLKMDVEGHEYDVLQGAERFFKHVKVHFVLMEFHFHKNKRSGRFIQEFMNRHGLEPDLPKDVSITNQTQWPWNVQWIQKNI